MIYHISWHCCKHRRQGWSEQTCIYQLTVRGRDSAARALLAEHHLAQALSSPKLFKYPSASASSFTYPTAVPTAGTGVTQPCQGNQFHRIIGWRRPLRSSSPHFTCPPLGVDTIRLCLPHVSYRVGNDVWTTCGGDTPHTQPHTFDKGRTCQAYPAFTEV